MAMCEVSVIIPVYNVEEYLERCINSVLEQTYTDYEVILINDGSTDNSGLICDRYARQYDSVKVINQENKGLALARKAGIDKAKGNYVIFVDSDDWIHEDMLNRMYQKMKETQSQIVCCKDKIVYENGKQIINAKMSVPQIICKDSHDSAYQMYVTGNLSASACAKMISTSLLLNVSFRNDLAIGEEHDMVSQLISLAQRVCIIPDEYYYYFQRPGSISRSGYNKKYFNSFKNYQSIRNKAREDYPEISSHINSYFANFEMAIITAMCRNRNFDKDAISELRHDLRTNIKDILSSSNTKTYMKICALMIVMCPNVFILIFRIIHVITGR